MSDIEDLQSAWANANGIPTSGDAQPQESGGQSLWQKIAALGEGSAAGAGARGFVNTLSFGLADEANAGLYALGDALMGKGGLSESYDKRLKEERGMQKQLATDHPAATLAGEVAGAVVPALATGGAGSTTLLGATGRAAAEGALQAGAQGFGEGEGGIKNRLHDAANDFVLGGAFGGFLGAAGYKIGKATKEIKRVSEQKSMQALVRARNDAYKAVADSGEVVNGAVLGQNMNKVSQDIRTSFFYDPTSQVDAPIEKMLAKIDDRINVKTTAGGTKPVDLTIGELDRMQRDAWKVYNRTSDPRVLDIINGINATMDQMAANGSDLLKQAREASRIVSNTKLFDKELLKADRKGKISGSYAEKYKSAAERILDNEKKAKFFKPEELEALQRIVDGDLPEKLVSIMKKNLPTGQSFSGVIRVLAMYYHPVLTGATLAAGGVTRLVDDALTKASAFEARNVISHSGLPQIATKTPVLGRAAIQTGTPQLPNFLDMILPQTGQNSQDLGMLQELYRQQQGGTP